MTADPIVLYIVAGMLSVGYVVPRIVSGMSRRRDAARRATELREAKEYLTSRGYHACLYFPAAGVDDEAVAIALRRVSYSQDRLFITNDGQLVGKISPETSDSHDNSNAEPAKRRHLTLVVSNTDEDLERSLT